MSPFTGDATILEKVLGNAGGIWKEMHGTIQSIRIFDRVVATPQQPITKFKVEIVTDESAVQAPPATGPQYATGVFSIEAVWDFMELKNVDVEKISLKLA